MPRRIICGATLAGIVPAILAASAPASVAAPVTTYSMVAQLFDIYACEETINYFARASDYDLVAMRVAPHEEENGMLVVDMPFENGRFEAICGAVQLRYGDADLTVEDWLGFAETVHTVARNAVLGFALTGQEDPGLGASIEAEASEFPLGMFLGEDVSLTVSPVDPETIADSFPDASAAYGVLAAGASAGEP